MQKEIIEEEKPIGECFCGDCEFWNSIPLTGNGLCCLNPPQVSAILIPGKMVNTMELSVQSHFPPVGANRSCAQARKRRGV